MSSNRLRFFAPIFAVAAAILIGMLVIACAGRDPLEISVRLFRSTLGSAYGSGQVVFKTTTLIFTGLAVALPFRARLFNIGGEGQLQIAAFTVALVGAMLPEGLSPLVAITLTAACAMVSGGMWGR